MNKIISADIPRQIITGSTEGADAMKITEVLNSGQDIIFVARDDVGLDRMTDALTFFAPHIEILKFPAWDCLPYDRVSPRPDVVNNRIRTLSRLLEKNNKKQKVIITTVSSLLQKVPPREFFQDSTIKICCEDIIDPQKLIESLYENGFVKVETVMEPGELALRGSLLDIFPTGAELPYRVDFFGNQIETIRLFNPINQRSEPKVDKESKEIVCEPISEVILNTQTISCFRSNYRTQLNENGDDDPLYESISSGRRHIGMEHWLPFFWENLETLFDYLQNIEFFFDNQAEEAIKARMDLIAEYFTARIAFSEDRGGVPYRPVKPELMFLDSKTLSKNLLNFKLSFFSSFSDINSNHSIDLACRKGKDFAESRVDNELNVLDTVCEYINEQITLKRRVMIASYSEGTRSRLHNLLKENGLISCWLANNFTEILSSNLTFPALIILNAEHGFTSKDLVLITEQDIFGDRLYRKTRKRIRPENFITEASALADGDFIIHVDHGVGQFSGLETICSAGTEHDCARILYAGGNKLFLPVENIELISRYGSEEMTIKLDKLGAGAWQARKARLKERIKEIATELIQTAASRELQQGSKINIEQNSYDNFCSGFPFNETEDQAQAIADTLKDLQTGRPMDRLICGDVGFGKTEVALRASFATALEGLQVAIIAPTTLLTRQHFNTFQNRFSGFPVKVQQLSRFITKTNATAIKQEMANGQIDIIIGTHALLAKDIKFRNLGLLVIDEEQHFGVSHKERLKRLKAGVHVLTLTATPIPRTLQQALTGLREMCIIASPPIDRLAVRTFILPYDPVIVREAILRERYRGGQTFYVCPRVSDLTEVKENLRELVPEIKIEVAHGRLSSIDLEETISRFYEGDFDLLLSTNIVESGLDLPGANTIIIHRADMFGLAQLYQLRGRVGRSKIRAYAYLTLPPQKRMTPTAEKRLGVMQTLDTLGAGFTLASHDLDIRGAGNLLGDEQSGHIREVGLELYQQMLEEAVSEARGVTQIGSLDDDWSPQIRAEVSVLIPDTYIPDLGLRMDFYRRLARVSIPSDIHTLKIEMIDRFGTLPEEVQNLLKTVSLKTQCKIAGITKLEAGVKGAVITFRNSSFPNPEGLIKLITNAKGSIKLRPDHKLIFFKHWIIPYQQLDGLEKIVKILVELTQDTSILIE